jgi:heat shock protein HslJ
MTRTLKTRGTIYKLLCTFSLFLSFVVLVIMPSQSACSDDSIMNINILSNWTKSGTAQLVNGIYRERIEPGSATETIIRLTNNLTFGALEDKKIALVVLCTDPGGSGTFYDLVYLSREPNGWLNKDTYFLGDRIKVHSLVLMDNEIIIRMAAHGPNDPMCCPSNEVEELFRVKGDRIVKVSSVLMPGGGPSLVGKEWRWQRSMYSNDTQNVPTEPERYTLTLQPEGKVNIRADCNRGGGSYVLDRNKISITITHTTRAACPPGSLEQPYIRDLNGVATWFFKDGSLYLDIRYDTGTMKFSK